MDLMLRRRQLMAMQSKPSELYPIGTDIVDVYIRQANGWQQGYIVNANGEFVTGTNSGFFASDIYIPVNSSFTLRKNDFRLGNNADGYCAWYDNDYQFISSFKQDNLTEQDLPNAPTNAAYLRISTRNESNARNLEIIRTA